MQRRLWFYYGTNQSHDGSIIHFTGLQVVCNIMSHVISIHMNSTLDPFRFLYRNWSTDKLIDFATFSWKSSEELHYIKKSTGDTIAIIMLNFIPQHAEYYWIFFKRAIPLHGRYLITLFWSRVSFISTHIN